MGSEVRKVTFLSKLAVVDSGHWQNSSIWQKSQATALSFTPKVYDEIRAMSEAIETWHKPMKALASEKVLRQQLEPKSCAHNWYKSLDTFGRRKVSGDLERKAGEQYRLKTSNETPVVKIKFLPRKVLQSWFVMEVHLAATIVVAVCPHPRNHENMIHLSFASLQKLARSERTHIDTCASLLAKDKWHVCSE